MDRFVVAGLFAVAVFAVVGRRGKRKRQKREPTHRGFSASCERVE